MTDTLTKEERSARMAKIKGKDTKPEMIVRKFLFSKGFRYRVNVRGLPGTPDIVLPKYKTAIFVHGCFWHGHEHSRLPTTNVDYWTKKRAENVERDKRKIDALEKEGWKVIVIWDCMIRNKALRQKELESLVDRILNQQNY